MKASSNRQNNPVWRFFSSVRLAVILLIILAIASIAGTLIPQGEPLQFYMERYGPNVFRFIKTLHINNTYHSWWFMTLLGLFSSNLTVCVLKRLPFTLKLYRRDNISRDTGSLLSMPFKKKWEVKRGLDDSAVQKIISSFKGIAGRSRERADVDQGRLFLTESGKWSYWGLYFLHSSILIIFGGALIGLFFGFKGNIMLAEGEKANYIVNKQTGEHIELGFSVRCDRFHISFYENGAPKEFRSDLTILNEDKEVSQKSIVVNDPLIYEGITFYQASYRAIPEATVNITASDGLQHTLIIPAFQKVRWPQEDLTFGLIQYLPNVHGGSAAKIWVADQSGRAEVLWLLKGNEKRINRGENSYRVSLKNASQGYLTGLQVKKDPGVWVVWLGCTILILAFAVVFWVPHQRKWLWIGPRDGKTLIILAGQTNKNRLQFEKDFSKIERAMDLSIGARQ